MQAVAAVALLHWAPCVATASTSPLDGQIPRPILTPIAGLVGVLALNASGGAAIVSTLLRAFPRSEGIQGSDALEES